MIKGLKADLRLSMYKDINIELFLELHDLADFLLHFLNILFLGDPKEIKFVMNE